VLESACIVRRSSRPDSVGSGAPAARQKARHRSDRSSGWVLPGAHLKRTEHTALWMSASSTNAYVSSQPIWAVPRPPSTGTKRQVLTTSR
jgi:hypothetical protein